MKTTELTDTDGDALTITQRLDATWITCTHGKAEVTVGPVPTDAIRAAFQEPMGGDDMDGGVTAAAIENEVVNPERARSLVQERDDWKASAIKAMADLERAAQERDRWREYRDGQATEAAVIEKMRPMRAEDVTDEMVERGATAFNTAPFDYSVREDVLNILRAALTPPPSRPEGAEDLDEWLRQANHAALGGSLDADQRRTLADHLAGLGVRAGGDR